VGLLLSDTLSLPSLPSLPPLPSLWVQRFAHLIRPQGAVLDVACGSGRHVRWLAVQGFKVTGVDRDAPATLPLRNDAEIINADIEAGPWPLPGRRFDAVLVTHYLWRPLWPHLLAALAEDGVLIYETFADGQQHIGRPSRAEFLLQPGELLRLCNGLRVVAFEDGVDHAAARVLQRIVAVRTSPLAPSLTVTGAGFDLHSPGS
jgi:SAM-dependent methyltransferase